jgi:hypothetical protein
MGAQVTGCVVAAVPVRLLAPAMTLRGAAVTGANMIGEAVIGFGFVMGALAVAQRRNIMVPFALGSYTTAAFLMTGHPTAGNPLLAIVVQVVRPASQGSVLDALLAAGVSMAGAAAALPVSLYLFPHARDTARLLLFTPRNPNAGRPRRRGSSFQGTRLPRAGGRHPGDRPGPVAVDL